MSVASTGEHDPTTYCRAVVAVRPRSWESAWEETVTGAVSFYRNHAPQEHFTTTVLHHDGIARLVMAHVIALLTEHDEPREHGERIGLEDRRRAPDLVVTDLGSGHGMLLRQVQSLLREEDIEHRVQLIGVDIRSRPTALPASIDWITQDVRTYLRSARPQRGVCVAHELLDDIPLPIVEYDEDGLMHRVDADPHSLGAVLGPIHRDARDHAWLRKWWPDPRPLARAEIGRPRDECWAQMLSTVDDGVCLAIDYGHVAAERRAGTWDGGTCVGYRQGRVVAPRVDGSCNITAHVAFDALAAVGDRLAKPVVSIHEPLPRAFGAPADMRVLQAWCGPAAQRSAHTSLATVWNGT